MRLRLGKFIVFLYRRKAHLGVIAGFDAPDRLHVYPINRRQGRGLGFRVGNISSVKIDQQFPIDDDNVLPIILLMRNKLRREMGWPKE